jgi:hypothetical protein
MRITGILFMILSLTIAACSSQQVDAQPPAPRELPPSISVETAQQLVLRQTLGEENTLYYNPILHPGGEAALYVVMNNAEYIPVITVFDTFTGEQLLALTTQMLSESWDDRYVASVEYNPDGTAILIGLGRTGSDPGELVVVDAADGEELHRFTVEHFSSGGAAYASSGAVIIAARYNFEPNEASLLVLDAATGDQLGSLVLDVPANWLVASGNTIAFNTYQGDTVITFQLDETGVSFSDPIYLSEKRSLGYYVFSPDGSLFTTYDSDQHEVRLYSTGDGSLETAVQVPGEPDSRIFDVYTDGELVVVAEENLVRIFDLAGTLLAEREHLTTAGLCRMDVQRITLICNSEGGVSIWGIDPVD